MLLPVEPHEAVAEVSTGKKKYIIQTCAYRIVCDNLDSLNLFSDDANKVGIVGFVAAGNSM